MDYLDLSHRMASTIPIEYSEDVKKKAKKSKALTSYRSSLGNASHKAQKEGCKKVTFAIDFFHNCLLQFSSSIFSFCNVVDSGLHKTKSSTAFERTKAGILRGTHWCSTVPWPSTGK